MYARKPTPAALAIAVNLCALLLLTACGGGGGGSGTPTPPQPVNQAPLGQSFTITLNEDASASDVLRATDANGDALTFSIVAQPSHGTVALTGSGPGFVYTPTANYFGPDQLSFQANDGKASSANATVDITVAPVNDAPVIDSITGVTAADARSQVVLTVASHDIDSTVTTLSIQQLSGTLSPNPAVANNTITITTPNSQSTEQVIYRIKVRDDQGAEAVKDYALDVHPVSASQNLHTLRGSLAGPGLHLVITGDGYTQAEQGQLLTDAAAVVGTMLDAPDIKPYSGAWNVHVLNAVSVESGVDIPSESIARNTIFDGTLECGGTARLLCVNTFKVSQAVIAEVPAYTLIVVVSNTDRYGGSGGAVSVASRHPSSALIVLHESGHTFARLVDEYVDNTLNPPPVATFPEASVPNATVVSDTNLVKWRYWFTNPSAVPHLPGDLGVGLFEGAYYRATGYYRPTDNSFMRTLSQNMGAVNTEAWVLSIYQRLTPVSASLPVATTVAGPAGTPLAFSVTPRFGPTLQNIKWFENGREINTAANQPAYQCCSVLTGQTSLTVKVSEASGLVKMPTPNAAYFEKTWQIQFN